MNSISEKLQSIKDEFSIFSDPRDKYVYLVDLAKAQRALQKMSNPKKTEFTAAHRRLG